MPDEDVDFGWDIPDWEIDRDDDWDDEEDEDEEEYNPFGMNPPLPEPEVDDEDDFILRKHLAQERKMGNEKTRLEQLAEKTTTYDSLSAESIALQTQITELTTKRAAVEAARAKSLGEVKLLLKDNESFVSKTTSFLRLAAAIYTGTLVTQ